MSSGEAGQMSAVETGHMSAAGTGQMSTGQTGRCPVTRITSVLSQQKTSVLSQQQTSVRLSRRHLSCLNNTLFVCQKQAQGLTHAIATDLDNRTVTFQADHTPQDRIAVRF